MVQYLKPTLKVDEQTQIVIGLSDFANFFKLSVSKTMFHIFLKGQI